MNPFAGRKKTFGLLGCQNEVGIRHRNPPVVMRPLFKQIYIRSEAIIRSVHTWWLIESRDVARKATASLSLQRGKKCEPEAVRWSVVTPKERYRLALSTTGLCKLQDPLYARMDALIQQMFAIPARTSSGRHSPRPQPSAR